MVSGESIFVVASQLDSHFGRRFFLVYFVRGVFDDCLLILFDFQFHFFVGSNSLLAFDVDLIFMF